MKLSEYLKRQNITATTFAETIGRDKSTVTRLCNGDRRPDPDTMAVILEKTGGAVQPNDFFDVPDQAAPLETVPAQPMPVLAASNGSQSGLKPLSDDSKTLTGEAAE